MDEKILFKIQLESEGNAADGVSELTKSLEQAQKEAEKLEKQTSDTAKAAARVGTEGQRSGSLLSKGFKLGADGAKLLGAGIKAAGIGLLLSGVTLLITNFQRFAPIANTVKVVLAGIGAVVGEIIEGVTNLGKALGSLLTGDLKGFRKGLADTAAGFDVSGAIKASTDAAKAQIAIERARIEFLKEEAQLIAKRDLLIKQADNENRKASGESIRLLEEADKIAQTLAERRVDLARQEASALALRNSSAESSNEQLREQREAEAQVVRLEGELNILLADNENKRAAIAKAAAGQVKDGEKLVDLQAQINQLTVANEVALLEQSGRRIEAARVAAKAELDTQIANLDTINATQQQKDELRILIAEANAKRLAETEKSIRDESDAARLQDEVAFQQERLSLLQLSGADPALLLEQEAEQARAELRLRELEAGEEFIAARLEIEQRLTDGLEALEIKKVADAQAAADARRAIEQATVDGSLAVANSLVEIGNQAGAKGSAFVAIQKTLALVEAAINIQRAAASAFAQGATLPDRLAAVAIVLAQGAKIIGTLRRQQAPEPTPVAPIVLGDSGGAAAQRGAVVGFGFAEGTNYVPGPGTGTSDSIIARLSKGEAVIPEKVNAVFGHQALDFLSGMADIVTGRKPTIAHELHLNQQGFMRYLRTDSRRTLLHGRQHRFS